MLTADILSHLRGLLQFWTWRGLCRGAWQVSCTLEGQKWCASEVSRMTVVDFSGKLELNGFDLTLLMSHRKIIWKQIYFFVGGKVPL